MHELIHAIGNAVEEALKRLLSEKHLYQAVEPELSFVPELAKKIVARPHPTGRAVVAGVAYGVTKESLCTTSQSVLLAGKNRPPRKS
jgi:hypothetical protein